MSADTHVYLCNDHAHQDGIFPNLQKTLCATFQPVLQGNHYFDFNHRRLVLSVVEFHLCGVTQWPLCVCCYFLLFHVGEVHSCYCVKHYSSSFLNFQLAFYSMNIQFICSPKDFFF